MVTTTRRYLVKMTKIYTVYDRVTGSVVGDSFDPEVNKAIMKPKGLYIDEKIDAKDAVIGTDADDSYHATVAKLRWEPSFKKL